MPSYVNTGGTALPIGTGAAGSNITSSVLGLRSLQPVLAGSGSIVCDSYNGNQADGAGGVFVWSAADTRADDGGTILAVAGTPMGRWNRVIGAHMNVRWFGAVPDGIRVTDGAISSGSHALACTTSNPFHAADVGKLISVWGAGAAGGQLATTISGFTDAGHVTLTAAASTSVASAAEVNFGTDNLAAINATIAAARSNLISSSIYFPTGIYCVSAGFTLSGGQQGGLRFRGDNSGNGGNTNPAVRLCLMTSQPYLFRDSTDHVWYEQIWFDGNFLASQAVFDYEYFTVEHHFEMCTFSGAAPLAGSLHHYGVVNGQLEIDFTSFHRCTLNNDIWANNRLAANVVFNENANAFVIKYDACSFRNGTNIFNFSQGSCDVYDSQMFGWTNAGILIQTVCASCTFQKLYNEGDTAPFLKVAFTAGASSANTVTLRDVQMQNTTIYTCHTMRVLLENVEMTASIHSDPAAATFNGVMYGNQPLVAIGVSFAASGQGFIYDSGFQGQLVEEVGTRYTSIALTTVTDGAINSASNVLNCATSNPFTAQSVGIGVAIAGAGAAGATLNAWVKQYNSASQVLTTTNASTSVVNASVTFNGSGNSPTNGFGGSQAVTRIVSPSAVINDSNIYDATGYSLAIGRVQVPPGVPMVAADIHEIGTLTTNRSYLLSNTGCADFGLRMKVYRAYSSDAFTATVTCASGAVILLAHQWAEFIYTPNAGWTLCGMGGQSTAPTLLPITAPTINNTLYVDSADNKLKWRGNSGTITILALP